MNGVSGKSGKTSSQDLLLKRLEKLGHEAGPAGLIRGADAAPGVGVKVFVATLQRVGPRKVEKAGGVDWVVCSLVSLATPLLD